MQRIFIAFPVSGEAHEELLRIQNELKEKNRDIQVSWTKTDMTHITLLFLGKIDGSHVAKAEEILEKIVLTLAPFSFALSGHEVFSPNGVVVVRTEVSGDSPRKFRSAVQAELRKAGIPFDEKDWKPHVTLARNKWQVDLRGLDEIDVKPVDWQVDEVLFMESQLGRAGHEHRVLRRFALGV